MRRKWCTNEYYEKLLSDTVWRSNPLLRAITTVHIIYIFHRSVTQKDLFSIKYFANNLKRFSLWQRSGVSFFKMSCQKFKPLSFSIHYVHLCIHSSCIPTVINIRTNHTRFTTLMLMQLNTMHYPYFVHYDAIKFTIYTRL